MTFSGKVGIGADPNFKTVGWLEHVVIQYLDRDKVDDGWTHITDGIWGIDIDVANANDGITERRCDAME